MLERRKGREKPKSVRTPTNGLSCKGSYAGEIPQSATKAKNDKRIEGHIDVDVGRFTSGTHEQSHQTLQKHSEHVWVLVVDTLNSSCETIIKSL